MSKMTGIRGSANDGQPPLRFDDKEWFDRLGHVVKSIGSRDFHYELVDLFGASIRHESCWIIRFSRAAAPEVLFTHNVAEHVVSTYRQSFSTIDPFSDYWQSEGRGGLIMLSEAKAQSERTEAYSRVFLPNANISDEMSVFLPTVGQDCYGLFLERETGQFSRADVERARRLFPALDGCHRAHLRSLFSNMRKIEGLEFHGLTKKPVLIQDRFGAEVYSNEAWNDALTADSNIANVVEDRSAFDHGESRSLESCVMKFESLAHDFPLAPGGRLFALEPHAAPPLDVRRRTTDTSQLPQLSPREREIFSFIMRGCTTGEMAQALKTSKGVIKNYKHRIYRKVCVDSERALVRKFSSMFWNSGE